MNNLCFNLNFNIDPFISDFNLFELPKVRLQLLDINVINIKLIDFLYNKGIEIRAVEVFYSEPNFGGGIHSDGAGDEGDDITKLNYIVGGQNSLMHWYKLKPGARKNVMNTDKGTPYVNYFNEDTDRIHTASVGFPSLVQVAVPHNVKNFNEPRYCICLVIQNSTTKQRLTFEQSSLLFQEYKI